GESPVETFAAVVRDNLADAVVVQDSHGKPLYPGSTALEAPIDNNAEWAVAREQEYQKGDYAAAAASDARIAEAKRDIHAQAGALQAEAACWLKVGRMMDGLARLSQIADDPTLRNAVSAQGTLVVPNAQLLLLKSIRPSSEGHPGEEDLRGLRQRTLN